MRNQKVKIMVQFKNGKLTPEQFRNGLGVSKREFLGSIVEKYNNTAGINDKAEVVIDKQ